MAKTGPARAPQNRPRGSRGKSGRQFTGETLARVLRNVDRDVLRVAIELADLQDVFTPSFEKDVRVLLEETAERQRLLEALAFGTVILKIFRTVIFLVKLLPQTRLLIIVLAIFVAIDRFSKQATLPTADQLLAVANETGLSDLAARIQESITERFTPLRGEMEELFNNSRQVLTEALFDAEVVAREITDIRSFMDNFTSLDQATINSLRSRMLAVANQMEGLGNLLSNIITFFVEGSLGGILDKLDELIEANLDFLNTPASENVNAN